MNISSRQLRAFVALSEERHFTRAARRCHLTQPAFSALIMTLEASLDVRLFDRSTRHVDLTPEGRLFDPLARHLLLDMEQAATSLRDHVARRRGRVAVAALPSLAAGWLPGILAEYHKAYPGVSLTLRDALLDGCLDMVLSGVVDFAVAACRDDRQELEYEFLHGDCFHVVCRRDHPLTTRGEPVRLRDLTGLPLIQMARNSSVRQHLESHPATRGMRAFLEVEHLATVTGLVAAGLGVSLVPAMTLFHFQHPDLAVLPLAGKTLTRSLHLVRRRGRSLSLAAQSFYDLLLARRDDLHLSRQVESNSQ